jgi:hypothetical protein
MVICSFHNAYWTSDFTLTKITKCNFKKGRAIPVPGTFKAFTNKDKSDNFVNDSASNAQIC